MQAMPFEVWLSGYLRWRAEAAKTLGRELPSEVGELVRENQVLAMMRWEAEGFRSDAVGHYYAAKHRRMEALGAEGVAKTAIEGLAKAHAHRELWARENAHGVAECVGSRAFAVKAELARLGVKGY